MSVGLFAAELPADIKTQAEEWWESRTEPITTPRELCILAGAKMEGWVHEWAAMAEVCQSLPAEVRPSTDDMAISIRTPVPVADVKKAVLLWVKKWTMVDGQKDSNWATMFIRQYVGDVEQLIENLDDEIEAEDCNCNICEAIKTGRDTLKIAARQLKVALVIHRQCDAEPTNAD